MRQRLLRFTSSLVSAVSLAQLAIVVVSAGVSHAQSNGVPYLCGPYAYTSTLSTAKSCQNPDNCYYFSCVPNYYATDCSCSGF